MNYPGGKNGAGVYQKIINNIPPHDIYIEPFLGSGAIMRKKKPANLNIGIDISNFVLTNFKRIASIPNLKLINCCALNWLDSFPGSTTDNNSYEKTFIYLDPPYLMETRSSPRTIYTNELTTADHQKLLARIDNLDCDVMISGYYSDLYNETLNGWTVKTFQSMTRGGTLATEYIWMNYPDPQHLHDYSYLGENFTDRQRIKRKIKRWSKKLENLPTLERNAILDKITR
jgi:site-specific DNA-adenine methylase